MEIIGQGVRLGDVEPTAEEAEAARVAAVEAQFAGCIAAGLPFQGQVIDIDDGSRANLSGMAQIADLAQRQVTAWPESVSIGWVARGNVRVPLPQPQDGLALALTAAAYYSALVQHEADLIADPSADPASGWPTGA